VAESELEGLKRRIRLTFQRKKAVAFVGWRDSYHDEFTRSIPREKVVFTVSSAPPSHVEFIFFTHHITPAQRGKIARGRSVSHRQLSEGEIKSLLRDFPELSRPAATSESASREPQADADEILDVLTKPQELSVMHRFVKAFREEAAKTQGLVGRIVLGKIIRECKTDPVAKLVAAGWIVGEIAEGKKRIGSYREGDKMQEFDRQSAILPDDPLERARFLLARKADVVAKKARLEAELAETQKELDLIEKVAQTIGQLQDLMK
jgi:hypothetical protein